MIVIFVVLEQTVMLDKEKRLNEVAIQTDNEGMFTHNWNDMIENPKPHGKSVYFLVVTL